jgi:glutathione synthase/RimK-type ligase-like ATP-grasp enzyme
VLEALSARGVSALRLDTDLHGDRSLAQLETRAGKIHSILRVGAEEIDGDEISAILYRHVHLHEAAHLQAPEARDLARSELRATLEGALLAIDCHWLNHPEANRGARSKPRQLALAARLGFELPETAITDDPQRIRDLYERWGGEMVAKLVGGQVIPADGKGEYAVFTTLVTAEDLLSEEALSACPAIYQRRVEKAFDVRVTVVGKRLFACRIDSQETLEGTVDWRRAGVASTSIVTFELDRETAERCLGLTRALGLESAGLDFVVTPAGEMVFLEVNAQGQWLWVQQATGMPIAEAFAERLTET